MNVPEEFVCLLPDGRMGENEDRCHYDEEKDTG